MKRFVPLDILRGLTVALMIVVNNPGSSSARFAPLRHCPWDGCTLTDLVFPTFLFCVGMAMAWSLARFGSLTKPALGKIFRRGVLIFLLGLFLNAFPFDNLSHLRIFGVLQRIACCYVLGAVLVLTIRKPSLLAASAAGLLAIYTAVLLVFGDSGAALTLEGNVSARIDVALFGADHVYHGYGIPFDPEGPLGILSATATVLLGYLVGTYVKGKGDQTGECIATVFVASATSLALSQLISIWIPINKPIWSASYVFYAAGWSMMALGVIMFFTELRGVVKPFRPALVFGTNAMAAYFLSSLLAKCIRLTHWDRAAVFSTPALSLLYALGFMLLIWLICLLMYRKKIFLKF